MARKPNAVVMLPPWQSWIVMLVGGLVLALVDVLTRSSVAIVLWLAGLDGVLVAASVFRYGAFRDRADFPKALLLSTAMCFLSSFWAGACRSGLCLAMCTLTPLPLCEYCSSVFTETLVLGVGVISVLMGALLSFTLGKQSLSHDWHTR